jgi:hypothetical protein
MFAGGAFERFFPHWKAQALLEKIQENITDYKIVIFVITSKDPR